MQLTTLLGTVAALAGLSQGFLVPPEISSADANTNTNTIDIIPFEEAVGLVGRVMGLDCPGCPVSTNFEAKAPSGQAESILQLNFTISHDNGADQLLLNGLQLYPIVPTSRGFAEPLTASQMVKTADGTWQYASKPRLGYSLALSRPANPPQDQPDVISIRLEIVEVADRFIEGLPTVDLQLLETPAGKLGIGRSAITAPTRPPNPAGDDRECTTVLCRWRAIVADRLAALKKGCGSKRPASGARPVFVPKPHHQKHPGHARPHGSGRPWRQYYRKGAFSIFLQGFVLHILAPFLIGIMLGITATIIGMVVGHVVIFTWRVLFRRGQNKYAEVKQEDADEESEVEIKGFLVGQGELPPYYDAVDEKHDA